MSRVNICGPEFLSCPPSPPPISLRGPRCREQQISGDCSGETPITRSLANSPPVAFVPEVGQNATHFIPPSSISATTLADIKVIVYNKCQLPHLLQSDLGPHFHPKPRLFVTSVPCVTLELVTSQQVVFHVLERREGLSICGMDMSQRDEF